MANKESDGNVVELAAHKRDAGRVWECNCGSILFLLTTAGIECANCGDMQYSDEWIFKNE